MSSTITLNTATLCEYKTGTLGPYTLTEANTQVTGSIYWTYKNSKIEFYFKATSRLANSYYSSTKGYIWYGNQGGSVRLTVGSTNSGWRLFVRQNSAGQITGYSAGGYQSSPGTYDQTNTVTVKAVTSAISLKVELNSSDTASRTVSFTPSKNIMVSSVPTIEYYRDGANVLARLTCVTTRSSTTYRDSYAYTAKLTINSASQSVGLTIPTTNTSATNTSSWLTVNSTSNAVNATVTINSSNGGVYSFSQTVSLSVPAMSTISGSSTGSLNSNYVIGITRYDSSFTDTLTYIINGSVIGTIASGITGSTSSYTWAVPISLASYAPNSTSLVITIRCTTSSGSTTIGYTDMSVTFGLPSSIVPTMGTVAVTKVNDNVTVQGWDVYLQSYSKCKIDVTGSSGIYGSTITGYVVKVGSVVVSGSGSSGNANWTGTSPIISASGTIAVSVVVTDSRGRTDSFSQNITVYQYSYPSATNTVCHRTDSASSSAESDDGTYIYMYAVSSYSSVGNNNVATMTIKYKRTDDPSYSTPEIVVSGVGASYGNGNVSVASAYDVVLTITDSLGNGNMYTFSLPTGMASIHIKEGGTGICFGGYSTHNDSFEIADDIQMIAGSGIIRATLPSSGIEGQVVLLVSGGSLIPHIYDGTSWISTLLTAYPIGSIYMSTVSTDPGTLFGGTWTQLEDRFLLTAGSTYTAGSTGGSVDHTHTTGNHTLTVAEMPSHDHGTGNSTHTTFVAAKGGTNYSIARQGYTPGSTNYAYVNTTASDANLTRVGTTGTTGSGGAHNHGNTGSSSNMPPYLVVYAWERTA